MSDMTQKEALDKAKEKWGAQAVAVHYETVGTFEVNSEPYSNHPPHWGIGSSWEAAFAHADRREREK